MIRAAVASLALAACCPDEPAGPDAAPPPDAPIGVPAAGDYAIVWSCVDGCGPEFQLPLSTFGLLTIEPGLAVYRRPGAPRGFPEEHAAPALDAAACLVVLDLDGVDPVYSHHVVCADGSGGVVVEVTATGYPGDRGARTWSAASAQIAARMASKSM